MGLSVIFHVGCKVSSPQLSQYEAKKYDGFQLLIRQLMHPSLNQGGFSTYPLIQKLTDRFYPKAKAGGLGNGDLMVLEGVV